MWNSLAYEESVGMITLTTSDGIDDHGLSAKVGAQCGLRQFAPRQGRGLT